MSFDFSGRKIDPHVHTSGISLCSRIDYRQAVDDKIAEGYGGMVLTNHCQRWYYDSSEHKDYCKRSVDEWQKAKEYAKGKDFLVLLGIEITVDEPYNDYLVYGMDTDFFDDSPCFYTLSQKELFDYCNLKRALLVQAHPYRNSGPAIPEYIHGTEINCTPGDFAVKDKVIELATKNGLMLFSGNDYHGTRRPVLGGMIIPESVTDERSFKNYLFGCDRTEICLGDEIMTFPVGDRDKKISE